VTWGLTKETITVVVADGTFGGWKSVSIKASAKSPERSFSITASDQSTDIFAKSWAFMPGTAVQVLATGNLVIDGYINQLQVEFDGAAHELRMSGRSKAQDMVDSSIDHQTNEFNGKTLDGIAQEIAGQWGISVTTEAEEALRTIDQFRINVGETGFQAIDRLARNEGYFVTGQADGSVKIKRHGKERHTGSLTQGVNLRHGMVTFDDTNKYSKLKVKGQRPTGTGTKNTQVSGEYNDPDARSGRTLIVRNKTSLDNDLATKKARQMGRVRSGESTQCSIDLPSWRDEGGLIWTPGFLVAVASDILRLDDDLAIQELTLEQGPFHGTKADLSLVDPSALGAGTKRAKRAAKPIGHNFTKAN